MNRLFALAATLLLAGCVTVPSDRYVDTGDGYYYPAYDDQGDYYAGYDYDDPYYDGYDDGYYCAYRSGTYRRGTPSILPAILATILVLEIDPGIGNILQHRPQLTGEFQAGPLTVRAEHQPHHADDNPPSAHPGGDRCSTEKSARTDYLRSHTSNT